MAFSEQFIDTLHPFTELAIGGGNPTIPSQSFDVIGTVQTAQCYL